MRLYSLKQSSYFQHIGATPPSPQKYDKQYSSTLFFESERLFGVTHHQDRCFLTVSDSRKKYTSEVVLQGGKLHRLHIHGECAIVRDTEGRIGWMEYGWMEKKCRIYEVSKVIIGKDSCKWMREVSGKGKEQLGVQIVSSEEELLFLRADGDSVRIWSYGKEMTFRHQMRVKFNIIPAFAVHSIAVDENYEGNGPICFITTVQLSSKGTQLYLCQYDAKNPSIYQFFSFPSASPPKTVRLCRMSHDMVVVLCDSYLILVERNEQDQWNQLGMIVPQGAVLEMVECEGLLVTSQKCGNRFCLFKYDLKLIISMKRLTPALLAQSKTYKPLCLIRSKDNLSMILWGRQPYLLKKSLYSMTSSIKDCQFCHEEEDYLRDVMLEEEDLSGKKAKPLKNFRLRPQVLKELSEFSDIASKVKKLYGIYHTIGMNDPWASLFEVVSEYLTNFIYITRFVCATLKNKMNNALTILPQTLEGLIHEVKEISSQRIYDNEELKVEMQVGNVSLLISISKTASHMANLASIVLKNKESKALGGLQLPQLFNSLYNMSYLVEYLLFKIKISHQLLDNQGYNEFTSFLSLLLQQSNDYPPLIYLIINRPLQYYINSYYVHHINNMILNQLHQNAEIIDFLKKELVQFKQYQRYHGLTHINSFSLNTQTSSCIDPANIYVKTNFKVKINDLQSIQKTQEHLGKMKKLHHKGNTYIEINEQEVFKMMYSRGNKVSFELSCLKLNTLLRFTHRLKLLNARVIKMIHLQHQESEKISLKNYKVPIDCKLISTTKEDSKEKQEKFTSYRGRRQPIIIEQPNLIDNLMQSYLANINNISTDFRLSFSVNCAQKRKQQQFSNFLKEERLNLSGITREEDVFYPAQCEIHEKEAEKPYKYAVNEALWDFYDSLVDIQQNRFEVYEHIRQKHFVQKLIESSKEKKQEINLSKLKQTTLQLLKSKNINKYKELILKLHNQRKQYHISIKESIVDQEKKGLWLEMIDFCQKKGVRWLGDPLDLLEDIIQIGFSLSESECKHMVKVFLALFIISSS